MIRPVDLVSYLVGVELDKFRRTFEQDASPVKVHCAVLVHEALCYVALLDLRGDSRVLLLDGLRHRLEGWIEPVFLHGTVYALQGCRSEPLDTATIACRNSV